MKGQTNMNNKWMTLPLSEIEIGMKFIDPSGRRGEVADRSFGAIDGVWDGDDKSFMLFPFELQEYKFMKQEQKKKKVLTNEEIYEMLLSDPSLHHVSLKAVRKIEKAVLTKLESLGKPH